MVQGKWRRGMLRAVFTQAALLTTLTSCDMSLGPVSPRAPEETPPPAPLSCPAESDLRFELEPSSPGPTILGKTMVPHDPTSDQAQKWYMQKGVQNSFLHLFPKEAAEYKTWCEAPLPKENTQIQLQAINERVETRVNYAWDNRFFAGAKQGEGDAWLAPFLSFKLKSGDCEDKALAKEAVASCVMPQIQERYIVWVSISDNTPYEGPNGVKSYQNTITGHHAVLAVSVGGHYFILDNDVEKGSVRPEVARTAPASGEWKGQYEPLYVFGPEGPYRAVKSGEFAPVKPAVPVCIGAQDRRLSFAWVESRREHKASAMAAFALTDGRLQPVIRQASEPRIFANEEHDLAERYYAAIGRQEALLGNSKNAESYAAFLRQFDSLRAEPVKAMARAIDDFVDNRDIFKLASARSLYGRANYVAPPIETVAKGAGDAVALGLLKLDILRHLGVPEAQRVLLVGAQGDAVVAVRQDKKPTLVMATPETDACSLTGKLGYAVNENGVWRAKAAVICPREEKARDRVRGPNLARR